MQRPPWPTDDEAEAERGRLQAIKESTPKELDFGAGDIVRLVNPHGLHYGSPNDWVTTGVGKVIVGGARLGYGCEATGDDYLVAVGGQRVWAKSWELSLLFAEPRLPPAEELEQEKKRRHMERDRRVADAEQKEKSRRERLNALKKRQASMRTPRARPDGEESEVTREQTAEAGVDAGSQEGVSWIARASAARISHGKAAAVAEACFLHAWCIAHAVGLCRVGWSRTMRQISKHWTCNYQQCNRVDVVERANKPDCVCRPPC